LLSGGARSDQLDKTLRHSFISTVATDFNIRLTAAGIGFSIFFSPNTGEFWELEKEKTFITMLTASTIYHNHSQIETRSVPVYQFDFRKWKVKKDMQNFNNNMKLSTNLG
jgi:hypothetical protein